MSAARRFHFETDCVHSDCESITSMQERAIPVTLATIRRHCHGVNEWARTMCYAVGPERGLHLADDWYVGYYRSTYQGRRCYYIEHSRIEHIFTEATQS